MKTIARIAPRKINAEIGVVDIEGDVNLSAETALMDTYADLSRQGVHAFILNFKNMNYMNSSGIGLLVKLLIRSTREGRRLLACDLSEHYREIMRITRLDEAITIYTNEEAALAAAKSANAEAND